MAIATGLNSKKPDFVINAFEKAAETFYVISLMSVSQGFGMLSSLGHSSIFMSECDTI